LRKKNLPSKICPVCKRPFTWRKKWRLNWEKVRYCSNRCSNKKKNLVWLNSKLKNIDLIENIYVQEFNKDHVKLRIKYLGKLEKIIKQLKNQEINLQLANDQWLIRAL